MRIHFISDLHLEARRPDISRAFLHWLKNDALNADALYILGDLFEVWVGDDLSDDFTSNIISSIKALSDSGTDIFVMHGNRDFLLGENFCKDTGSQLLEDPSIINLDSRPVLLMHGDSLCTLDKEYITFRQQVRNPQWIENLLSKPLNERQQIARQLRDASQSSNQHKQSDLMDVTPAEVEKIMEEHGVSHLIHGHTHRPAIHTLKLGENQQTGTRRVLGDWDQQGWVLNYLDGGFDIQLIPYPDTALEN